MKVGDLVRCRHFNKYGIITREPQYNYVSGSSGKELKKEILWAFVLWDNGIEYKWKASYLEVVNESG